MAAVTVLVSVGALVNPAAATAHPYAAPPTPGSAGAGDPYFPLSGNGGFDVGHYDINLAWSNTTGRITAHTVIKATAIQALSRFDLDLSGLTVRRVTVDGRTAAYARHGQELVITPPRSVGRGQRFTVAVDYDGVPQFVTDPDGSPDGWIATGGGVFVASEPQGAMTWFPASSHPIDKASFDVTVTVPAGYTAVGNGRLVGQRRASATSTFHWRETLPMAAYLATASIAKFQVSQYTVGRLPVYVAVDPREAAAAAPVLKTIPAVLRWETATFGPYPFDASGAIVMHAADDVGYALETQTRPIFDEAPDQSTLVHELAHQWFGDSVSITRWQDIWLNEGFATYAEWLYSEQHGGPSAQDYFDELYAESPDSDVWAFPPADPGEGANIFADPVYERGAMTLHELRRTVGDHTFLIILRTWAAQHRYAHGTTAQFIALSSRLAHRNLTPLFHTWLYTAGKPAHA
jgi:aminopeptidase N